MHWFTIKGTNYPAVTRLVDIGAWCIAVHSIISSNSSTTLLHILAHTCCWWCCRGMEVGPSRVALSVSAGADEQLIYSCKELRWWCCCLRRPVPLWYQKAWKEKNPRHVTDKFQDLLSYGVACSILSIFEMSSTRAELVYCDVSYMWWL